ncbi:hypothetical protein PBI_MRMAGOO_131 [Mycobacterium phage MrMagoo]|uniref:Uncharacterized protein n=1 Tax=Mycobacterium phage MrMagoo TaxID=1927020 RepID=A0A1L6BYP4_9CAUD|nr:hypothetical protein J4U04_gp149 [Mycobacterium phage MrMagoo]APQ42213.1 hypothetical protein PBI_MRMAGOO_131 [Mycobacterium phage MrMagoo]
MNPLVFLLILLFFGLSLAVLMN